MELSRRNFLKAGGAACLVAGAGAFANLASAHADEAEEAEAETDEEAVLVGYQPVSFSQEVDILIVGSGYSGLAAAMEPALAGKNIMIVDKKSSYGGDSSSSCCFMFAYGTELQLAAGWDTTIDAYWESSQESLTAGYDDYDWYPEWVKGKTYANTAFIDTAINEFGATFQEPATIDELPRLASYVLLPGDGIGTGVTNIMQPIVAKLEELGVDFEYNLRATALIKDAEGAVIGCRFENTETAEIVDVKAAATVLATGGFADNGEMMVEYVPDWADYGQLVHGCTGDGHKMAVAAGAMLTGMDTSMTYCNLMGDIPNCTTWGYWTPIVLVLPNGKRFIEEAQSHDAAQAAIDNGYREWWSIFDQRAFDCRCIGTSVEGNINTHQDAYATGETVEELAEAMGVPVDTLVETFARYDELVEGGEDLDFGKAAWLESLEPPYHALRLNVCRYKSSGGLMVGANNQVLDTEGAEIPGLYAAGALTTLSYASVSTCMATGYYVGQTLAEL